MNQQWFPKRPKDLAEAEIRGHFVREVILKSLYVQGTLRGIEFVEIIKLPFSVIDGEIAQLRAGFLIAPVGGSGIGGSEGIDFSLTKDGREQAGDIFRRNAYIGPAPVSMDQYKKSVKAQHLQTRGIKKMHLERVLSDLVLNPGYIDKLGTALNSGGPIFLYGNPGNGKTMVSERLARIFTQGIWVPYAIQVDDQIIQFYDEKTHRPIPEDRLGEQHPSKSHTPIVDLRWVYVTRPFVIVGGELTLAMLDLIYRENMHCYEAPFQLKANCGVLLVDDFGRQIVKPRDFLNRWIFPLEKQVDFLSLVTGKKIEVPFDQVLIFSTNLRPNELADEAFWRRIKYKIEIPNPNRDEFLKILKTNLNSKKIAFQESDLEYLVQNHYAKVKREFRAVHSRDIVGQFCDQISYQGLEHELNSKIIDSACELYFGFKESDSGTPWKSG